MRAHSSVAPPLRRHLLLVSIVLMLGLSACDANDTPTPLPTVDLDGGAAPAHTDSRRSSDGVTASGVIVPIQEAKLAFSMGGLVDTVGVRAGDRVVAGQVMVVLASSELEAAVDKAERSLGELTSPASVAAAERRVAEAQQALEEAQEKADALSAPRGSIATIRNLEGRIDLAEQELERLETAYRAVQGRSDGDPDKAEALVAMTDAQLKLDTLVDSYVRAASRPSGAEADAVRADLAAAKATLEEAQWYLSALEGEPVPDDATGSDLAQLSRARDELAAAEDQLESARLVSPIDGTVAVVAISQGEYAVPGQVVITVSDTTSLRVETTDLSELDVTKVEVGQEADVYLEALDREVDGQVSAISPVADTLGGDVVYRIEVDLESQPDGMRPGMSAEVRIDTTP